ncbi:hypothetical protein [Arthrobacter sp. A5]|uniref:hypothetical protein n=1 Tax=Arthrobacter sp. A5 TaxID=576926 RepID=UPI003DA9F245
MRRLLLLVGFRTEILAEWADNVGSYFSEEEIMGAVADYEMTSPEDLEAWIDRPYVAAAGVDWGYAQDANALTLVSVLEDYGQNRGLLGEGLVFFIPYLEVRHKWAYSAFIDRIVEVAGKYYLRTLASETNGVGQYPTEDLRLRMYNANRDSNVASVVTDVRRKQSGFSMIRGLLQLTPYPFSLIPVYSLLYTPGSGYTRSGRRARPGAHPWGLLGVLRAIAGHGLKVLFAVVDSPLNRPRRLGRDRHIPGLEPVLIRFAVVTDQDAVAPCRDTRIHAVGGDRFLTTGAPNVLLRVRDVDEVRCEFAEPFEYLTRGHHVRVIQSGCDFAADGPGRKCVGD